MTKPTIEQKKAIDTLRYEYGQEALLSIERRATDEWPHGIVRMLWRPEATLEQRERALYIRPDGTRLSWETIEMRGT